MKFFALLLLTAAAFGATNPDIAISGQLVGDQAIVVGENGTLTATLTFPSGVTNPGGTYNWTISNGAAAIFVASGRATHSEQSAQNTSSVVVRGLADADITITVQWQGPSGWEMPSKSLGVSIVEVTSYTAVEAPSDSDHARPNIGFAEWVIFRCRRAVLWNAPRFEPSSATGNFINGRARLQEGATGVSAILPNGRIATKHMNIVKPSPIVYTLKVAGSANGYTEIAGRPDVFAQLFETYMPLNVSFYNLEKLEEGGNAALPVSYDGIFKEIATNMGVNQLSHGPSPDYQPIQQVDNKLAVPDNVGFQLSGPYNRPTYSPSTMWYLIPIHVRAQTGTADIVIGSVNQRCSVAANGDCTVSKETFTRTAPR